MSKIKILQLLPEFKRRFFHNFGKEKNPYGIQRKSLVDMEKAGKIIPAGTFGYDNRTTYTITDHMLMQHFSQKPVEERYYVYGCLGILGDKTRERVKFICFDADEPWQIEETHNKLLPALRAFNIEYIKENSREGRMHIWIMVDIPRTMAEHFCRQVYQEKDMDHKKWEIYPLFARQDALIRIPGGYHLKAEGVGTVEWKGEVSNTPEFIMSTFNSAPIYNEDFFNSILKPLKEVEVTLPKREKKHRIHYTYLSRNLPPPIEGLPKFISKVSTECQAIRKLVFDMANQEVIQKRGIPHHNALLALSGLAYFDDKVIHGGGKEWWDSCLENFRDRNAIEHMVDPWAAGKNPNIGVWKCDTYDRYFELCQGCPHRNRDGFETPKQLYFGKTIEKIKVEDVY